MQVRSLVSQVQCWENDMELVAAPEGFVLPDFPSMALELWFHKDVAFLSLLPATDEPHVYSARQARVVCVTAFFLGSWVLAVPGPSCAWSNSDFLCWKTHAWCVVKALGNPLVFWGALSLAALFHEC